MERLAALWFNVRGEAPVSPRPFLSMINDNFKQNGFEVHNDFVDLKGSRLLVIVAMKNIKTEESS
jgi:hypothetical protein